MALWSSPSSIYIALTAGDSDSMQANITAAPPYWDTTSETYNNNVGASEVLGASIGYVFNPLFRVEIGADHRNSFKYAQRQTAEEADIFDQRTRYFNLSNTTIMSTLFLNGSGISDKASAQHETFMIDPFIGFGLGLAFNSVDNLHSVEDATQGTIATTQDVFSFMTAPRTTRVLAYQFIAGFDVKTTKKIGIGVNYRYLDAGRFESNNYIADGALGGMTVPPWKGTLKTNEIYVTIKYAVN
ncbi:MAG: outer membrane beta-barrel protein [Gammaproteobacteria bacterium]|nr:outer membrane beta-barrel protein [Gammaproteobacteria bacterium]MCH9763050.1 outer membrane beta-barrel protein [Gammaproteobacteria bacterium]